MIINFFRDYWALMFGKLGPDESLDEEFRRHWFNWGKSR